MKGTIYIIRPDQPIEVRMVAAPMPFEEIQRLLGGLVEVIPMWDYHLAYGGEVVRCIALCNEEAAILGRQFNFTATAMWQFMSRVRNTSSGVNHNHRLSGPVLVFTGDDEFLDNVLD